MSIAARIAAISPRSLMARSASTRPVTRPELDRRELLLERQEIGGRQRGRLEAEPGQTELLDQSRDRLDQGLTDRPDLDLQLGAFLLELRDEAAIRDHDRAIAGQDQRRRIAREAGQIPDVALGHDEQTVHLVGLEPAPEPFATLRSSIHAPLATRAGARRQAATGEVLDLAPGRGNVGARSSPPEDSTLESTRS